MPLLEHGFLGAEGEKTRQQILEKYAEFFARLKELNDICHEYLRTLNSIERMSLKCSQLRISFAD
jgi:hypothetical protein